LIKRKGTFCERITSRPGKLKVGPGDSVSKERKKKKKRKTENPIFGKKKLRGHNKGLCMQNGNGGSRTNTNQERKSTERDPRAREKKGTRRRWGKPKKVPTATIVRRVEKRTKGTHVSI